MLNKEKSKKSSSEDNKAVTFRVKTDIAEKIRQIAKKEENLKVLLLANWLNKQKNRGQLPIRALQRIYRNLQMKLMLKKFL